MKKFDLFLALIFFSCLSVKAQNPEWDWVKYNTKTGTGSQISSLASDPSGNVYAAGQFGTAVNFGNDTLSNYGSSNIFLTKYNAAGNVQWSQMAYGKVGEGTQITWTYGIAVDGNGNIFVAGYFYNVTMTFGSTTLTNADPSGDSEDIFLAKYDKNGNLLWANSYGGSLSDAATGISMDANGNVYMTGYFNSATISFDTIVLTNDHVRGYYYPDIFIAKFDNNGNVVWAKQAGGSQSEEATAIATDNLGNSYINGWYTSDTTLFGNDTLFTVENGSSMLFLAKYDSSGNIVWAKSAGAHGGSDVNTTIGFNAGNLYVGGAFASTTMTFDTITVNNPNTSNGAGIFIAKYNVNGNAIWAQSYGGLYNDYLTNITVDSAGNAFFAGYYYSPTMKFGSLSVSNKDIFGTIPDIFLVKFAPSGNPLWVNGAGGLATDETEAITSTMGNVYVGGYTNSAALTFDTITFNLPVTSYFLAKIAGSMASANVSRDTIKIPAYAQDTASFQISSNASWNVSSNDTWLTPSASEGSGNAVITLTNNFQSYH